VYYTLGLTTVEITGKPNRWKSTVREFFIARGERITREEWAELTGEGRTKTRASHFSAGMLYGKSSFKRLKKLVTLFLIIYWSNRRNQAEKPAGACPSTKNAKGDRNFLRVEDNRKR
jgi:hypothetical protein